MYYSSQIRQGRLGPTSRHRFQEEQRMSYHPQLCPDCRKMYSGSHLCKITCHYCHDVHFKKDLIDNMCPVMQPHARKLQDKHSFQCKNCKGEGSYTEQVKTIRLESQKKYEKKLKEWSELHKNETGMSEKKPERRIIHSDQTRKEIICQECEGKGKIMRIVACCTDGCSKCGGDKYRVNPVWKKYRKEPIPNEGAIFQCPICLDDVDIGKEKYTLQCQHEFHPECIFKWLRDNKRCPVCRRHDFYMEDELMGQRRAYQMMPIERLDVNNSDHYGSDDSFGN